MLKWEDDGFKVELDWTGRVDRYNKYIYSYKFYDNDELIFEGDDYCPSPILMKFEDDPNIVGNLLSFLSLQLGDTDPEYFEDYTDRQMAWCMSQRCEELKMIGMMLEEEMEKEAEDC